MFLKFGFERQAEINSELIFYDEPCFIYPKFA
jgi:hypothetical protein